jgi:collagenase-like PrtC family protease
MNGGRSGNRGECTQVCRLPFKLIKNGKYIDTPNKYLLSTKELNTISNFDKLLDSDIVSFKIEGRMKSPSYVGYVTRLYRKLIDNHTNKVTSEEAEKISDFLRVIKAFSAVMYFEDIRIYRDHKNMTNRLNNCEQANIDKIFLTASKQVKDIEKLYELDMVDTLDDKLKEVIEYRMKYKESSLSELANIISSETGVEITKSGLNHRFRKIKEILENYLKEKEKSK